MSDRLDPLWAATLDAIEVDLLQGTIAIGAHAVDDGRKTTYGLECVGVTAFSYTDPNRNLHAWPYVEITSAELGKRDDGRLEVALCLWDDEREFSILCEDVRLGIDESAPAG
jgi:hypothetical protein